MYTGTGTGGVAYNISKIINQRKIHTPVTEGIGENNAHTGLAARVESHILGWAKVGGLMGSVKESSRISWTNNIKYIPEVDNLPSWVFKQYKPSCSRHTSRLYENKKMNKDGIYEERGGKLVYQAEQNVLGYDIYIV